MAFLSGSLTMDRFGIEDESWFEATRQALGKRGFTLRIQPKSIVVEHPSRLPRIFGSSRDLLDFAQKQGVAVSEAALALADLYGDGVVPPLTGRRSPSPFETPPELLDGKSRGEGASSKGAADYLVEAERRLALEAEVMRLQARADEAEKQCSLWQMSANAAEDRLRGFAGGDGGHRRALERPPVRGASPVPGTRTSPGPRRHRFQGARHTRRDFQARLGEDRRTPVTP